MKKISLTFLLSSLIFALSVFAGCYRVNAAPKRKIVGTYRLTRYERSASSTEEAENYLETRGIECYLVVPDSGEGYYIYKDSQTAPYCLKARIGFEPSDKDENKIAYVSYMTENKSSPDKLAYSKGVLNRSEAVFAGNIFQGTWHIDYTVYTDFSKVDKAQDLSFVKKQIADIVEYDFGEYNYNGYFNKCNIEYDPTVTYEQADIYVYYFLKLDSLTHKAIAYYMLKSDMLSRTEALDYDISVDKNEFDNDALNITIGDNVSSMLISETHFRSFEFPYTFSVSEHDYTAKIRFDYNEDIVDNNLQDYINLAIDENQINN